MTTLPVLLVPGLYDTHKCFNKMSAFLQAQGIHPLHAMDIVPSDASIPFEAMGEQVMKAVYDLQQAAAAPKVDIVAYSMGTLAVRCFLHLQGGKPCVRRFISIAGPHHGTWVAYLGWNTGSHQMRPGSSFLKALNQAGNIWGSVEAYSFWSPFDLMIFPSSSSVLEGAVNRTFGVPLHPLMLTDRRVIAAVAQTLTCSQDKPSSNPQPSKIE